MKTLVMGTRGSPLALAQSRQVAAQLKSAHRDLEIEERIIRTTGDARQNASLPAIGGKGVFTLEIEDALTGGEIDFAVHSLKDLPPDLPEQLCLAAIPQREDARDVCVFRDENFTVLEDLPIGARIGTSSLRRAAQLLHLRPDFLIGEIRGNIDTRLKKLRSENFDAIILAAAGLNRLKVSALTSWGTRNSGVLFLSENSFIPAPGQGALAIEARRDDAGTLKILRAIEDTQTRNEIIAERAVMRALNAGCSTPLGARAIFSGTVSQLRAVVLSPDGTQRIFAQAQSDWVNALLLGEEVARQLVEKGARSLLPESTPEQRHALDLRTVGKT